MPGLHAQLTSSELTKAIASAETLCGLKTYIEPGTAIKIDTLRVDLIAEQEDRDQARARAAREDAAADIKTAG